MSMNAFIRARTAASCVGSTASRSRAALATRRRSVFGDQALQVPFQDRTPASFETSALLHDPVIEADGHTLKIVEKAVRTIGYFKRIDPADARIQPHGVALPLKSPWGANMAEIRQRMPQGI